MVTCSLRYAIDPSKLAQYEQCSARSLADRDGIAAFDYAQETKRIARYGRSFRRPAVTGA